MFSLTVFCHRWVAQLLLMCGSSVVLSGTSSDIIPERSEQTDFIVPETKFYQGKRLVGDSPSSELQKFRLDAHVMGRAFGGYLAFMDGYLGNHNNSKPSSLLCTRVEVY